MTKTDWYHVKQQKFVDRSHVIIYYDKIHNNYIKSVFFF